MGWQQRFIKFFLIILRVAIKAIYQLFPLSHQLFNDNIRLIDQLLWHLQRIIKLCWAPAVNAPVFAVHSSCPLPQTIFSSSGTAPLKSGCRLRTWPSATLLLAGV